MKEPFTETRDKIRRFVLENLAAAHGIDSIEDSDSLVASGLIDSMGIFQLVAFLEDTFAIRIGDEEVLQKNFRTVDAIEAFVVRKLGGSNA